MTQTVTETVSQMAMLIFVSNISASYLGIRMRVSVACDGLPTEASVIITYYFVHPHGSCDSRIVLWGKRVVKLTCEIFDLQNSACSGSSLSGTKQKLSLHSWDQVATVTFLCT